MTPASNGGSGQAPVAQRLARLLRHEVGDLLQSVYSTTAILLDRLSADQMLERRLLADLKQRAEVCRFELDAALDLVSRPALSTCTVDLVPLLTGALAGLRNRFPALRITGNLNAAASVQSDPRALHAALSMLLLGLAQTTQEQMRGDVRANGARIELEWVRDGCSVPADELEWLTEVFATTQQALFGMALALTARVVREGGGEVEVNSPREGGVCVRILFPVHAAA